MTIKSALDDIPDALRSVNRQRDDLVKLLEALKRLSGVGVRVIRASKESTINSLRDLAPVLEGFAKAGENFPKSFQVFLTYPFVDEAVGRDPQVARNLHMGDYTNLSVNLDINVADLPSCRGRPRSAAICTRSRRHASRAATTIDALPTLTPQQTKDRQDHPATRSMTRTAPQFTAVQGPESQLLRGHGCWPLCGNADHQLRVRSPDPRWPAATCGAPGAHRWAAGRPARLGLPRADLGKGYQ